MPEFTKRCRSRKCILYSFDDDDVCVCAVEKDVFTLNPILVSKVGK